jgi:hypothetical protein
VYSLSIADCRLPIAEAFEETVHSLPIADYRLPMYSELLPKEPFIHFLKNNKCQNK